MSHVTDILICSHGYDCEDNLDKINKWVEEIVDEPSFNKIDQHAGGRMAMQIDILAGSFKYFPIKDFIAFIRKLDWKHSTDLFIQDEHDDRFKIHTIKV